MMNRGAWNICAAGWDHCKDPVALIFHAYIKEEYQGGVPLEIFTLMKSFESVKDAQIRSMICLYQGLYYLRKQPDQGIYYLEKSIEAYDANVHSYYELGRAY